MTKIPIFAFVFLLPFISSIQAQSSDYETLRYLKEVEWPKAYREQDTVLLDRILAEEFQMITHEGIVYKKQDELEYIKQYKPSYDSFRYEITRLEVFENETAIVSGEGHTKGKDDNGSYSSTYSSSNILIKRKGKWKAISSHVSGVKKEYFN